MAKVPYANKKRLIQAFAIFCAVLVALSVRVGYIQVVKAEEYTKMAMEQQTKDELVEAKRGDIVDRNGNKLAVSTIKYSVWVRPGSVRDSNDEDESVRKMENDAKIATVSEGLAEILGVPEADIAAMLDTEKTLVKVAKYQERETADKIRQWAIDNKVDGISISEETKRYYPMDTTAAHVLGSVTDDNNGLSGLELYYNSYLKGVPGRWIQNKDAGGRSLSYGTNEYYDAVDGATVVSTLDVMIQSFAEERCLEAMQKQKADQVACIVMETKTGEILAMCSYPTFDPNNPRMPLSEKEQAKFKQLKTEAEQLDYLNDMWRNPLVNDTYIPGSTFKVLTTSMALEEDLTTVDETYYCRGHIQVYDADIKDAEYPKTHGTETMQKAVRNSCNPAMVTLARRVGIDKFYTYLGLFGLDQPTGIDYPGEATSILQPAETAGPVGLATMGFGQGMAVTPIQQITAINTIGNDGKLVRPHLVKEIVGPDGETIEEIEPQVVRQAISSETASAMLGVMEFTVNDGGVGKYAKIKGYRTAGKGSTANVEAENNKRVNSYICIGPVEDPEFTVLFIVWNSRVGVYGSEVAVPSGAKVLEDCLHYHNAAKVVEDSSSDEITVPDMVGKKYSEAKELLKSQGLSHKVSPDNPEEEDFVITDQYPKGGETIEKDGVVYLYYE